MSARNTNIEEFIGMTKEGGEYWKDLMINSSVTNGTPIFRELLLTGWGGMG